MKKVLPYILYFFMALAALLRFVVFLQSRDLFIDEVNLARNVYEKSFSALLQPLSYEQFAPPLFLWITKASTVLFGYSEMALRLFPYLSGIASILLLVYLIDILLEKKYAIYPLALFAGSYLFLHYGTELKQYSSDFMMTLVLLIAAIKSDNHFREKKFLTIWIVLGSIAIWLSMPAVFVLFGIGCYWLLRILSTKDYKALNQIIAIGSIWLLQFAYYFFFILQDQISSEYLQVYHEKAFLLFPKNLRSLVYDLKLLSEIIGNAGGFTLLALICNSLLILLGGFTLMKKEKLRSILFFLPLVILLFASLFHKYALVDRLVLFIQPIIFILVAYGLYALFQIKNKFIQGGIVVLFAINIFNHQNFKYLFEKLEIQEIHYALDELEGKRALKECHPIWVHNGAVPSFIFYTEMSPKKKKYGVLMSQGKPLCWDANYEQLCADLLPGERVWILLTNYFSKEKGNVLTAMHEAQLLKTMEKPGCLLLYFEKK